MRLALNQESVCALRELANEVPHAIQNILEASESLINVYNNNVDRFGSHSVDFFDLIISIQNAQKDMLDSISVIPALLIRTAESIEAYLSQHPEIYGNSEKDASATLRGIGAPFNSKDASVNTYSTINQHLMSVEDINYWYKKKLESIEREIANYREALLEYGVPDGEWLKKTLAKHKAAMKEQASYDLCVAAGYKEETIQFRKNAYPPIADYHSFYLQLVEEYKSSTHYQEMRDTPIDGNSKPWYGNFSFVPLLTTNQKRQVLNENGRKLLVFDHPFGPHEERICNQGSAFPSGPQGTCGCCACGTIINRAGGFTTEKNVVDFALKSKYCSDTGGTSPEDWIQILDAAGISSRLSLGCTLSDLALSVEQGYGVIIGVSACTYCPEMYGRYMPGIADGHALVLESVIRDEFTGEILEYIVSDSNGDNTDTACQRVPAKRLEKAFQRKHAHSIITNEVIW